MEEHDIRINTLARYFEIMNLAVTSQQVLNKFLEKIYPSIKWHKYYKHKIAIEYAIGGLLTEADIHKLRSHFGNKKNAIDIASILQGD